MIAKLIPADGSEPIVISRDLSLVGRKRTLCDVVLDNSSVSKLHCAIARTDGLLFIRDLGSTNGTKVNGQKVTRGALLPGDELAFGSVKFKIHLGPGEPPVSHLDRTEALTVFPKLVDATEEPPSDEAQPVGTDSDFDVPLLDDE